MTESQQLSEALNVTPHQLVSQLLKAQSEKSREKLIEDVIEKLNFERFDAETLVSAAADSGQLRDSLNRIQVVHVGKYTFLYIQFDVVTWRIIPSPENVRFEDSRLGTPNPLRYEAVSPQMPVLKMHSQTLKELTDLLNAQAGDIWNDNPHTKTIQHRGIEVGGWLSLARFQIDESQIPYGALDATDGFSRTVGAHKGLGLTPRDVITKLSINSIETGYRKDLLDLSKQESPLTIEEEARLRSSVMPRAHVIVGYEYRSADPTEQKPSFDKARRNLVAHLHLAPQHAFSAASKAAAKANAIADALIAGRHLPVVRKLKSEELAECLLGNNKKWLDAGYSPAEFAVFVLETYKPTLLTKRGRAIKGAIEDLTGQTVKQDELAEIAADVALRPVILTKKLSKVEAESLASSLRSVLSKTWQSSIFTGVQGTQRKVAEILSDALFELNEEQSGRQSNSQARSELAALASFGMIALTADPLLKRAPGRKGLGNNDEPSKVIQELLKSTQGINQLAQVLYDIQNNSLPRLLTEGMPAVVAGNASLEIASPEAIQAIYLTSDTPNVEYELSSSEKITNGLRDLIGSLQLTRDRIDFLEEIRNDADISVVKNEGLAVTHQIDELSELRDRLVAWNSKAKERLEQRQSEYVNPTEFD